MVDLPIPTTIVGFKDKVVIYQDKVVIESTKEGNIVFEMGQIFDVVAKVPTRMSSGFFKVNGYQMELNYMDSNPYLMTACDYIKSKIPAFTVEEKEILMKRCDEEASRKKYEKEMVALKEKAGNDNALVRTLDESTISEMRAKLKAEGRTVAYEYKVIDVMDDISGKYNNNELEYRLNVLALEGWRVKSVLVNELGKNALFVLGFGTNATIEDTRIVLEREIIL